MSATHFFSGTTERISIIFDMVGPNIDTNHCCEFQPILARYDGDIKVNHIFTFYFISKSVLIFFEKNCHKFIKMVSMDELHMFSKIFENFYFFSKIKDFQNFFENGLIIIF